MSLPCISTLLAPKTSIPVSEAKMPLQVADNSPILPVMVEEQNYDADCHPEAEDSSFNSDNLLQRYQTNQDDFCLSLKPVDFLTLNSGNNFPCAPSDIPMSDPFESLPVKVAEAESMDVQPTVSVIAQPNDGMVVDLGIPQNNGTTEYIINYHQPAQVVAVPIPKAAILAVNPLGQSFPAPEQESREESPMDEGEYDQTHQPDDGVGEIALHDHTYGTKDKTALDIIEMDMNKDADLQKGLEEAIKNLDEVSTPVPSPQQPQSPAPSPFSGNHSLAETEEHLARSLRNRKLLIREFRESRIRCLADVSRLSTDKMRQLAPRLVRYLMYQYEDHNKRGIYKEKPEGWPKDKFFGDPCNKTAEKRPTKDMVKQMCMELYRMYLQNHEPLYVDENK